MSPAPSADPAWLYVCATIIGAAFLGFVIGWIARQATLPVN